MRKSVLAVLVIIGILATGCGPAMIPSAAPQTESGETFVIALPQLVITFDADGKPGIEGLAVEDIARTVGYPLDLGMYRIDPFYVNWMTTTNVQHIELRQTGASLALLVNGVVMPHVNWSDQSLTQTADLAPMFNLQGELLKKFVPMVTRLGVAVVLKFPAAEGAAEIPLASDAVVMAEAQPSGDPTTALAQFEIKYSDQGVPAILGISAQDLQAMGISAPLALHPAYISMLQANNIQNMQLKSVADGLYVFVNGVPLPNIVWDKTMLSGATDIWAQMNPGVAANYVGLIKEFAPLVSNADIGVLVHFPVAAGAEVIPAVMH